jgi:gluconolactonase
VISAIGRAQRNPRRVVVSPGVVAYSVTGEREGEPVRRRGITRKNWEDTMRVLAGIVSCLLLAAAAAAADVDIPPPTGDSSIVDPEAKWELLYTRSAPIKGGLTEGPTVAPDGSIYFSDIPFGSDKGLIMRFDPRTKKTTVFTDDSHKSNGLKFDAEGFLIACEGSDEGGQCVSRWNVHTKVRTIIADKYMGKRFNAPNDVSIDRKGRIYFSDPRYLGFEPQEIERLAVYRINRDRSVEEITHDCEKPNGIVHSPDEKTLYVVEHNNGTNRIDPKEPPPKKGAMKLYAFPLGPDGLVAGERRTLIDFGDEDGIDGMAVDVKGNLYLAVRSHKRPGIWVVNPDGKELAYVATGPSQSGTKKPVGIPSNCTFGIGDEASTLYCTVDVSLYRMRFKVDGYHIPWKK